MVLSKDQQKTPATKQFPQYLAVFTVVLSLVSTGFHFGWPSPSIPKLLGPNSPIPNISTYETSWITTIQPLGDVFGGPLAAILVDVIGRKYFIMCTAIPHLLAWTLIATAQQPSTLLVARFFAGVAEGAIFTSVPMYIGEVAEPKIRGIFGICISTALISGILLINIIGAFLSIQMTAIVASILPLTFLATFVWMPESPYFYLMKKNKKNAEIALQRLRGVDDVDEELNSIGMAIDRQTTDSGSIWSLINVPSNRKALMTMFGLRGFQQLSGVSIFSFYTQFIFVQSGIELSAITAAVIYTTVQLLMTFASTFLVDSLGRRPLLMFSGFGSSAALILGGIYFYMKEYLMYDVSTLNWMPVTSMITFIVLFSVGLGPVPNLMLGEFFAANVKAKSLCLNNMFFSIVVSILSSLFIVLIDRYGMFAPFWLFGMCSFISIFFSYFFVPETKGKTLEEIQQWFRNEVK